MNTKPKEILYDKAEQILTALKRQPADNWRPVGTDAVAKVRIEPRHVQKMTVDMEITDDGKRVKATVHQRAGFNGRWYHREYNVDDKLKEV